LKDSVNDYYAGVEARAIDVAVRIRTLVHDTDKSHAFLGTIDPNFQKLDIYRKRPAPKDVVFSIPMHLHVSGVGPSKIIKDDFALGFHELIPLERWWTEDYLRIGAVRSSKRRVVLDVANTDGGAHVDPEVPARHVVASEPPLRLGQNENSVRPDLARSTVAQAGHELLDYLERHFQAYIA
jgi:hypothetical protein